MTLSSAWWNSVKSGLWGGGANRVTRGWALWPDHMQYTRAKYLNRSAGGNRRAISSRMCPCFVTVVMTMYSFRDLTDMCSWNQDLQRWWYPAWDSAAPDAAHHSPCRLCLIKSCWCGLWRQWHFPEGGPGWTAAGKWTSSGCSAHSWSVWRLLVHTETKTIWWFVMTLQQDLSNKTKSRLLNYWWMDVLSTCFYYHNISIWFCKTWSLLI